MRYTESQLLFYLCCFIAIKLKSSKMFFKFWKQVKSDRTVWRMIDNSEPKVSDCYRCRSTCMRSGIVMLKKRVIHIWTDSLNSKLNYSTLFLVYQRNYVIHCLVTCYNLDLSSGWLLITSLPEHTQRLLVLLFGTFRVIATNAERARTGMTSEALGVSVAPSFFQSCVSDGKTAKMEDVMRFKVATRIMKFLIDNFGVSNLFGRENYEFYARITGRILKVEDDWIFSFRYPPDTLASPISHQEESQSTPALIHVPEGFDSTAPSTSLGIIPENNLLESYTRLSISLEENGLFKGSSRSSSSSATTSRHMTLEELRAVNRYAESTKSLSYLPQVHERQTARMRTRSEWFLSPSGGRLVQCSLDSSDIGTTHFVLRGSNNRSPSGSRGGLGLSASAESLKRPNVRRSSSRGEKSRHHLHRSSSRRKNKENGAKQQQQHLQQGSPQQSQQPQHLHQQQQLSLSPSSQQRKTEEGSRPISMAEMHTVHVTLTYKPRI
ncbi:uncharacterized protein LOC126475270 isoform X3 [Schistocerca serialis cubense]|uniref:uncharacterized protein LOC126475270 isoform X3 n=1 Tax=Schistocerca serialis cubense TaxID=2023355 RepID=UPI00214EFB7C|nr:uncharacterized protein LOC126475270 isoform X3 [Schistocerca serialis cubense]